MVGILVADPVYIPFTGVENIMGKAVPLGGIVPGEFFFCPGGAVWHTFIILKPDDAHDARASEVAAGRGGEGGEGRQQEEGQGEGEGCGSLHGCVPPCSVNSGYTGSIPGRHRHWMSSI